MRLCCGCMAYSMHHVPTSGDRQAMASCIPKEQKLLRGSRTLVSSLGGSTLFLCLYYINLYNLYTISILYGNMVYYGIIMRSLHLRQLTPGMIGMGLSQTKRSRPGLSLINQSDQ